MGNKRILIIGYGNPGRGDDGVGPALVQRLEALAIPGITLESDYQLTIEHAAMAAEYDIVVFVDAAADARSPFYFRAVPPAAVEGFTSHGVTPGEVLGLAQTCFHAKPQGFLLGIQAPALDRFEEGLSSTARKGLQAALDHLLAFIQSKHKGAEG
jgi:hydrogenase maturation protease